MTTDFSKYAPKLQEPGGHCVGCPNPDSQLRCVKTGRFICPKCAIKTPVGYISPEANRALQDRFYNGETIDYFIAVGVALPLSVVAAFLFNLLPGFFFGWIIAFFGAPFATGLIAEAVRWAVKRRRSRYLWHTVAGCLIVATVPFLALYLLVPLLYGFSPAFFAAIPLAILLFMGTGTIRVRLG